jgi:hypothetical protein
MMVVFIIRFSKLRPLSLAKTANTPGLAAFFATCSKEKAYLELAARAIGMLFVPEKSVEVWQTA